MKFKIFATSSRDFRPKVPLDESKYNLKFIMDKRKNPNKEWSFDEWHYEINITSLKQLIEIVEDVGEIIIGSDDRNFYIEIYDYYRE